MKCHIDKCRRGEFDRVEPCIERAGREHLVEQRLWHRFARAIMHGILFQNGWHGQPMLIELRWQFDKVARNGGAGNCWPGHIRQKPMQRMAELMEQCARVVQRKQRWFTGLGFCKIHHIVDDRLLPGIELMA
ncbi:hypothetical protein FQZ97_955160 [compost metagenome]